MYFLTDLFTFRLPPFVAHWILTDLLSLISPIPMRRCFLCCDRVTYEGENIS